MTDSLDRRDFLKKSLAFGVSTLLGQSFLSSASTAAPEVAVAHGTDYSLCTRRAVALLGGMEKYVPKGAKVAILPNSQSKNPGGAYQAGDRPDGHPDVQRGRRRGNRLLKLAAGEILGSDRAGKGRC